MGVCYIDPELKKMAVAFVAEGRTVRWTSKRTGLSESTIRRAVGPIRGSRKRPADTTPAVEAVLTGVPLKVAAFRAGCTVNAVRKSLKEAGHPCTGKPGPKPADEGFERFRKDVADLLEDEGLCRTDHWRRHIADLITDLAAASLRRNRR